MKKIFKALTSILLASSMLFSFGCADTTNGPNTGDSSGKKKLPTSEYEDDITNGEYVDNTPEDPGTPVNHIFEAEAADFIGTSTNGTTSLGALCIAKSYFFDLSFSDSAIIRNVTSTSNKYIFEFHSDKAYKVNMEVAVASAYTSGWVDRNLSAMFDIVVNERQVTSDAVVPAGNAEQVKGGNNFTCIQNVEIPISLVEGNNLIVFNVLAGVCNLDYINIKTSATITGYTEKYWQDDDTEISITKLPTETTSGTILLSCTAHNTSQSFTLPALSETNGYTVSENNDVKTYSFKFNGQIYSFSDNGDYSVPDEVVVPEPEFELTPEEDEAVDPNAPAIPEVVINNKDFFKPSNWTLFSGNVGAVPTALNGALKFTTNPARFDFFYVNDGQGEIHVGELASKYNGRNVYGNDYSWTLEMSARYSFDMLLFGTASAPVEYGQSSAAGVYLTFENNKIKVKNAYYNSESTEVIAEGSIPTALTFDGKTKFTVKITANRVDDSNLQFSIEINGEKINLTSTDAAKLATVANGIVNLKISSTGSYGQRLCIMPRYVNNVVRIYSLTKPSAATTPVEPEEPEEPPVTAQLPEVMVNGKDFFTSSNWTTFTSGTAGAKPTENEDALEFTNASRFDFFYVYDKGTNKYAHLGDHSNNLTASTGIYQNEYSWTLEASANSSFDLILFGGASAPAIFTGSGAGVGAYLTFADGKISVRNAYLSNEIKDIIAEADVSGLTLDGTHFTLTINATRIDATHLKFGILINNVEVEFTAVDGVEPVCTEVEEGCITLTFTGNSYGQRLCVVPGESTVKIYNLTIPD